MRNLELKAPVENLALLEQKVVDIGAQMQWRKKQTDTYFRVANGKLKLREQEGSTAELIAYFRPDNTGSRVSDYQILFVDDPDSLKGMLEKTMGVIAVVSKERTLYLWENVRIHFDAVDNLGKFIEFEAVMNEASEVNISRERIEQLSRALNITPADTISGGYLDMLTK